MQALSMSRGDTFRRTAKFRRDPVTGMPVPEDQGVPLDLTGALVWFTVKRYVTEPDAQAVFQARSDDGSGNVSIDAPATLGQVTVRMPASKTINFPDGTTVLVYDLQVKDAGGLVTTWEAGTISVDPDVTRATS